MKLKTNNADEERLNNNVKNKDSKNGPTFNQLITVAGISMSLFATGNITGFSSVTTYQLTQPGATIKADHDDLSYIASLVTVGMFIGTLVGGIIGDVLGRRRTIIFSSLIFCAGWIVIGFANSVGHILVGRLMTGAASGIYSTTVQCYICEVVDKSIRGVSGSIPTIMVSFGVICMYTFGSLFNWRMLALGSSVFPLFVCCYMFFLPDSPAWLISKGKYTEAVKSLTWLRNNRDEAEEEVSKLSRIRERRQSLTSTTNEFKKYSTFGSFMKRFSERSVLYPLGIGVALFFFQKFCGVSSITFYATLIFKYADSEINDYVQTIVIGFVRLISHLVSVFLIKYFPRKVLLITSGLMMFASNGILGGYFYLKANYAHMVLVNGTTGLGNDTVSTSVIHSVLRSHSLDCLPLICVTVFMVFSSIGFGIIPFFLVVELLPSDVRSVSCSIAYGFCQLCQFLAVKTFMNMLDSLDTFGTFWFYSAIAFCGAAFVAFFVPETSNLNSAQIEKLFESNNGLTSGESSNTSSDYEEDDEDVERRISSTTPLINDSGKYGKEGGYLQLDGKSYNSYNACNSPTAPKV